MFWHELSLWAGIGSTLIFIGSNLPMLIKVLTTREMGSYSLGQITLANAGNALHWLYVAGLPAGPAWLLHGFNSAVALVMLGLYWRYAVRGIGENEQKLSRS